MEEPFELEVLNGVIILDAEQQQKICEHPYFRAYFTHWRKERMTLPIHSDLIEFALGEITQLELKQRAITRTMHQLELDADMYVQPLTEPDLQTTHYPFELHPALQFFQVENTVPTLAPYFNRSYIQRLEEWKTPLPSQLLTLCPPEELEEIIRYLWDQHPTKVLNLCSNEEGRRLLRSLPTSIFTTSEEKKAELLQDTISKPLKYAVDLLVWLFRLWKVDLEGLSSSLLLENRHDPRVSELVLRVSPNKAIEAINQIYPSAAAELIPYLPKKINRHLNELENREPWYEQPNSYCNLILELIDRGLRLDSPGTLFLHYFSMDLEELSPLIAIRRILQAPGLTKKVHTFRIEKPLDRAHRKIFSQYSNIRMVYTEKAINQLQIYPEMITFALEQGNTQLGKITLSVNETAQKIILTKGLYREGNNRFLIDTNPEFTSQIVQRMIQDQISIPREYLLFLTKKKCWSWSLPFLPVYSTYPERLDILKLICASAPDDIRTAYLVHESTLR